MSEQALPLGDVLSRVMSDPALMASLRSTAQTLFGEENTVPSPAFAPDAVPTASEPSSEPSSVPAAAPSRERREGGRAEENEQRIKLLLALKPYMDEGRRGKIDTLLRIMNLMKLSELGGLFKGSM